MHFPKRHALYLACGPQAEDACGSGGGISFGLPSGAGNNGKLNGYYSWRVSQVFWDTLNIKLEHINYKQLDTSYRYSVDDQSLEILLAQFSFFKYFFQIAYGHSWFLSMQYCVTIWAYWP